MLYSKWGLGIGDWGLGIGDWAQSPIPNPHPQSPIPLFLNKKFNLIVYILGKIIIFYFQYLLFNLKIRLKLP
jgi:hypothetical protein